MEAIFSHSVRTITYKRHCPVFVKGVEKYLWDGVKEMTID